mmetsp:Transcript_15140/g.16358  ORF Transcript_15140/g.16358 Transcript_15140/m.16358 type:complete len:176 (+) Transcript_15140:43-570(+)
MMRGCPIFRLVFLLGITMVFLLKPLSILGFSGSRSCRTALSQKPWSNSVHQKSWRPGSLVIMSASSDNKNDIDDNNDDNSDNDDEDDDNYDFNAGFKDRVKQGGGKTSIKLKTASRSATKSTISTTQGIMKSIQENPTVYGLVFIIVAIAIASQFTSPTPFEQSTNGEQLTFGAK